MQFRLFIWTCRKFISKYSRNFDPIFFLWCYCSVTLCHRNTKRNNIPGNFSLKPYRHPLLESCLYAAHQIKGAYVTMLNLKLTFNQFSGTCKQDWTLTNRYCYFSFHQHWKTWFQALASCARVNAYLADFNNGDTFMMINGSWTNNEINIL